MAHTKRSPLEKIATIILLAAGLFSAGFYAAQSKYGKSAVDVASGNQWRMDMQSYAHDPLDKQLAVWGTAADALEGGAVLIGAEYSQGLAMLLINGEGKVLNRWTLENKVFNPDISQWWKTLNMTEGFAIDDAHLMHNGDAIFVQENMDVNNYRGQRLARMDKDSHIVWQVIGNFHHYLHVDEAAGKIYAISSRLRDEVPQVGPKLQNVTYLDDWVEVFTTDGKRLDGWSITDAFANSPYREWLTSFEMNVPEVQRITTQDGKLLYDLFHINSVQHLDAAAARALPGGEAGDILISMRTLSALVLFRPSTQQIVWAGKGPFLHQHSAQVRTDGKLYLYDNEGRQVVTSLDGVTPFEQTQSRVIRFDPFTNRVEEVAAAAELKSFFLGNYEQTPSGAWVVSSPEQARVAVMSPKADKVIWQLRTVPYPEQYEVPRWKRISFMHYYPPSALTFLKDKHAP